MPAAHGVVNAGKLDEPTKFDVRVPPSCQFDAPDRWVFEDEPPVHVRKTAAAAAVA